jgi:hypothetical protein
MGELYRHNHAPSESAARAWAALQLGYVVTNCHKLTTGEFCVFVKRKPRQQRASGSRTGDNAKGNLCDIT